MSVTAEALPTMTAIGELLELNAGLVGPSTGYMVGARGDWPRLIAAAESCSLDVVELSALSAHELPGLLRFLGEAGELPFGHVSVHGPSKGWDGTPAELADALSAVPRAGRRDRHAPGDARRPGGVPASGRAPAAGEHGHAQARRAHGSGA